MPVRMPFELSGTLVNEVCFPDDGVVSVVARSGGSRQVEAGLIGREGMTGLSILLGDDRSPNETYVQIPGAGHVVPAETLRTVMRSSPTLKNHLLKFALIFMTQVTQTALANGRDQIDVRLARWLLMASDRVASQDMALTHEFIAIMLGVRRPGVTDALHRLEGRQLILSRRSAVSIRDRAALENLAGPSYGVPEAEYRRLLGQLSPTTA
jgi:CRP-like cAMP-binding protein